MGFHRRSESFYLPRDNAESQRQARKKHHARAKTERSTEPQYFVPSYSVRRQVLATDEVLDFLGDLRRNLPRNYKVYNPGRLAMTIVEQKMLISRFRQAGEHPSEELVEGVARTTARELKHSLHGVPRNLNLPLGRADRFGRDGKKNQIGLMPLGWRGYSGSYAERDESKNVLPMPVIVRETNICLGGIASSLGGNESLRRGIVTAGMTRTPHITIARKEKGGPISQSEMQALSGVIEELSPESVELFDPTIHLTLKRRQQEPISIHPRSQRLSQFGPLLG